MRFVGVVLRRVERQAGGEPACFGPIAVGHRAGGRWASSTRVKWLTSQDTANQGLRPQARPPACDTAGGMRRREREEEKKEKKENG